MNQIPHHLGAGRTVKLNSIRVPVNIGTCAESSSVQCGAVPDSPIGPRVVLSIAAAMPGEPTTRAHMAHLTAAEACYVAGKLLAAAADIEEAR